ncbi:MAG: hypothetical protein A3H97_03325 [Acidobacteria bacterium RIFCSPLOWO2_02_FULL_65_29]|nr:MAG: hypothetical protein A3H97_03325 [Acidobacteria bacterium RIFCSPLOWO2_02_FULL_65_29]
MVAILVSRVSLRLALTAMLLVGSAAGSPIAQQGLPAGVKRGAPVERLGPDSLRVGNVKVDTAKKEVAVAGVVNNVTTLEFIANTKGGFKAYESALELDTDAVSFNLALILIGLDPSRAIPARFALDPTPPQGDPVEIWVEWDESGRRRRVRAEQLVFNQTSKQTLSEGPWVYTGSTFSVQNNAYLADLEGSLIGFIHSNAPVIESPRPLAVGTYGSNRVNPDLNLKAGTSVLLIVRALPRDR